MQLPTEERTLFAVVRLNKFAHLVDGMNAAQVALVLRGSPGEQPMPAK